MRAADVVVVGGGQSALATGYYLRRTALSFVLLDEEEGSGGAWRHTWPSLRLFSPAQWSSLPGWMMPAAKEGDYPTRDETIAYLAAYEERYAIPVERPTRVTAVRRSDDGFVVESEGGRWAARAVVSATGSAAAPHIPELPGRDDFEGRVLHSSAYRGPAPFAGASVVVVGGGNSGAQIVADLAGVARVQWATLRPPRFLPDDVDGRTLFDQATARYRAQQEGNEPPPFRSLGDIVMVPPVRAARDAGWLRARPMFTRLTRRGVEWPDGSEEAADAVVLATGFAPALSHLAPLGVLDVRGRVQTRGTQSVREPRLWLVGYGDWTGFASATLIGVGRSARATAGEIAEALRPAPAVDRGASGGVDEERGGGGANAG